MDRIVWTRHKRHQPSQLQWLLHSVATTQGWQLKTTVCRLSLIRPLKGFSPSSFSYSATFFTVKLSLCKFACKYFFIENSHIHLLLYRCPDVKKKEAFSAFIIYNYLYITTSQINCCVYWMSKYTFHHSTMGEDRGWGEVKAVDDLNTTLCF